MSEVEEDIYLQSLLETDDYRYFWNLFGKHYEISKELMVEQFGKYQMKISENKISYGITFYKKGSKVFPEINSYLYEKMASIEEAFLSDNNLFLLNYLIELEAALSDKYYDGKNDIVEVLIPKIGKMLAHKYETDDLTKIIDLIPINREDHFEEFAFAYRKNHFAEMDDKAVSIFKKSNKNRILRAYLKQYPRKPICWYCFNTDPYDNYVEIDCYTEQTEETELKINIQFIQINLAMMKGIIESNLLSESEKQTFIDYREYGMKLLKDF